jgi:hypothetical protein
LAGCGVKPGIESLITFPFFSWSHCQTIPHLVI